MLIYYNGRVTGYIPCNFFLSLLIYEAAKSTHINIVACCHITLHNIEKCFNGCRNICFVDTSFVCNLVDYVCFCHNEWILIFLNFWDCKFRSRSFKSKINLLTINKVKRLKGIKSYSIQ